MQSRKSKLPTLLLSGTIATSAMIPSANALCGENPLALERQDPRVLRNPLQRGQFENYTSRVFTLKNGREVVVVAQVSVGVGGPLNQDGGSILSCWPENHPGQVELWLNDAKTGQTLGNLGLFVFDLKPRAGRFALLTDIATSTCGDSGVKMAFLDADFKSLKLELTEEATQKYRIASGMVLSAKP